MSYKYKWKPNKTQKKEFAIRMQDPDEKQAYLDRKMDRADRKRSDSEFNYESTGGFYIPTKIQYDFVMEHADLFTDRYENNAANDVVYGYTCQEKIHHDSIHIVNEKIRNFSMS